MRYTILLLALLVLATVSCKKDDDKDISCKVTRQIDNNTGVITSIIYKDGELYRVEQSNGNSAQITLNSAGKVVLYEMYNENNNRVGYVEFEYTSDGRFLERRIFALGLLGNFNQRFRDVYEYMGGEVSKITNYDLDYSSTSINGYTTYTYNAQGNITEENQYGRDGSNNVILINTITYQYDDKNTPAGDLGDYLSLFSNNNITVKSTTTYFPSASTATDSLEYVYNEYGYPTKVTTFKDDGGVDSYDVEYSCD